MEARTTRAYDMSNRAAAAEVLREQIVDAAYELFLTEWYDDITLKRVAAAAGVALQTVVNHFGTKEGLFAAVVTRFGEDVRSRRYVATPGDVEGAVRALVGDYEQNGDAMIRTLAIEERVPAVQAALAEGRASHREWVEFMFAAALAGLEGIERRRRTAQLVTATDVYAWKLLRRDQGLSRAQTVVAITEIVAGLHDTDTTEETS